MQPTQPLVTRATCTYPATVMAMAQDTGTAPAVDLTDEQLAHYRNKGFVAIENLVSEAELAGLQERLRAYTHGGRSQERIKVQTEPRVTRGELSVAHPGDGIRKIDGLVESDDLFQALGRCRRSPRPRRRLRPAWLPPDRATAALRPRP